MKVVEMGDHAIAIKHVASTTIHETYIHIVMCHGGKHVFDCQTRDNANALQKLIIKAIKNV